MTKEEVLIRLKFIGFLKKKITGFLSHMPNQDSSCIYQ
jgi:hypothetical protein